MKAHLLFDGEWVLTELTEEVRRERNITIGPNAVIHEAVRIGGPCEFRGGTFWGGMFRGGMFRDGEFRGGTFMGGEFRGGMFWGGTFWGGMFMGGEFRGGTFKGGTFWGGMFRDGEFRGGTFKGGMFRDGTWKISPLQIQMSQHFFNVSAPYELQIGCERHSLATWQSDLRAILSKHGPEVIGMEAEIQMYIDIAAQWHVLHIDPRKEIGK